MLIRFFGFLILTFFSISIMSSTVHAIDFKIRGIFGMAFGVGETDLIKTRNGHKADRKDIFQSRQRVTLNFRAIASESLEGQVIVKASPQVWGQARTGGALGADGVVLKLGQANLQWMPPDLPLKVKMGLQYVSAPSTAGGSSILEDMATGIVANYAVNDNFGITTAWIRPFNDNYAGGNYSYYGDKDTGIYSNDPANYLDNMDLFMVSLPLTFENLTLTPWAMYGFQGRNVPYFNAYYESDFGDGAPAVSMSPFLGRLGGTEGLNIKNINRTSKPWNNMFWAGLPVTFNWDDWNFEFDFNYGYVESLGKFDVAKRNNWDDTVRGSWERKGWVAKALAEYKYDWGKPGIFGWYGSGDDGNVKNGSERMPSICAYGTFTSFMGYGDGLLDWETNWFFRAKSLSYAGTWGVGAFIKDVSFIENMRHLLRVAYWGGTNSPSMVKYMTSASSWNSPTNLYDSLYMTTNDGLLEFNFVTHWDIYENFQCLIDTGYIANFMDDDTWKKSYNGFGTYQKQDAWKAQVIFTYAF